MLILLHIMFLSDCFWSKNLIEFTIFHDTNNTLVFPCVVLAEALVSSYASCIGSNKNHNYIFRVIMTCLSNREIIAAPPILAELLNYQT